MVTRNHAAARRGAATTAGRHGRWTRGAAARFLFSIALCAGLPAAAAIEPAQVLVLVNKDAQISSQVAAKYQKLRGIPNQNVLRLSLGTSRVLSPEDYWKLAAEPIRKHLDANPSIRCILTTAGVPYVILGATGDDPGAAFDNELAAVLRQEPNERKRHLPNPLYLNGANPYAVMDPRLLKMVYVARLDGPDLNTITRMIEDAIAAEKSGLAGPVAGDAQGLDGIANYGLGDYSIRAAIDQLAGAGFPASLDMKPATWKQPPGGVGNQAAGAAFYMGWYALLDFQDIFGQQGLARGAIAWHIASQEAQNLWDLNGRGWCINLMRRGAAVTLGPVREPYVDAFPSGSIFVDALLSGATVAESYWLALPHISWAMVILGDPLYRPFALHPKPALVARAYVAGNSSHVLRKGETASLLVQLDCVGPEGSYVPALSAVAEPEMGLAAASGTVQIPALRAGQSTVVRVPSVTAGDDPTGMFRLRLNVETDAERSRRIVLEGRIGFSRLTGGVGPKTQMFVSPAGNILISGKPGNSALIDTATLRSQPIAATKESGLVAAEFSPDGANIAMALTDPQQKIHATLITDDKLENVRPLPLGSRYLRWLEKDSVLLVNQGHLVRHSIAGGDDHVVDGSLGPSGNVIPGTDIQFSVSDQGKVLVQVGSAPAREVLQGTKVNQVIAVANDLSLFGGLDAAKRLWVQHGFDQAPEVVATGVEKLLWGPISRRALVQGTDRRSRIYDGRDRSWLDLGSVALAQWSPDEETLLFSESDAASPGYLSLLTGRKVQRLCDLRRIGHVVQAVIPAAGGRAFLLATLTGELEVWVIAL